MRPVRVALLFAGFLFAVLIAPAAQPRALASAEDRTAFRRWFTFLAESRYYARKPLEEVRDGDSLIRWAFRHALAKHEAGWSRRLELPVLPAMPSVREGIVAEASPESAFVSREVTEAQPGDLLLYRNAQLPAHMMVFIGKSQVVPSSRRWVIYIAADGVHKVALDSLLEDPCADWRPVSRNPEFRGVWRLGLLHGAY